MSVRARGLCYLVSPSHCRSPKPNLMYKLLLEPLALCPLWHGLARAIVPLRAVLVTPVLRSMKRACIVIEFSIVKLAHNVLHVHTLNIPFATPLSPLHKVPVGRDLVLVLRAVAARPRATLLVGGGSL